MELNSINKNYKVYILCPSGHKLYPQGIKPKTFTKKCGYSINSLEYVELSTFKLDKKQFKHLDRKCKVCSGEIVLKTTIMDIINRK